MNPFVSTPCTRRQKNDSNLGRIRIVFYLIFAVLFLLGGVPRANHSGLVYSQEETKPEPAESDQAKIKNILLEQTTAWNEGDLEKFMQTYWKSEKLTFSSGGKTTYGWQATLDNYKKSYPTIEKMGKLHFDGLEISMIESKSALVLGNFHLTMSNDSTVDGNFSLVVKKFEDENSELGWKIIHDHSSALDERFKKKKEKAEKKD